jgi:hypothetical protein
MTQLPPPTVDRRSGEDRRRASMDAMTTAGSTPSQGPRPRSAPFIWIPELDRVRPRDPWVSVVRRAIADYQEGQPQDIGRSWDESVEWRVVADWPGEARRGPEAVFEYHRAIESATAGSFQQEIVSLDASGGPIVVGHVRTTAARGARRLEMPSLLTFELVAMRVARVTEIPGDAAEWDTFWQD